jgi:PIN domain nuclease of toxin-antitoxin system
MSQMIILDTHIWFWLVTQDWNKFPAAWREEIETAERVGISPISCYEIVLLRTGLGMRWSQWILFCCR